MGAYLVIALKKTAIEAWSYFEEIENTFVPFRDAISGECTYPCSVLLYNY